MAEFLEGDFSEEDQEEGVEFTLTGDSTFRKKLQRLCQFFETSSKANVVQRGVAVLYIFAEGAKENLQPALVDKDGNVVKEIVL